MIIMGDGEYDESTARKPIIITKSRKPYKYLPLTDALSLFFRRFAPLPVIELRTYKFFQMLK